MQTKKIISIALTAALVSSVAAVATLSASALDNVPEGFTAESLKDHTVGVVGSFFDEWVADAATLTDRDGDNIYVGVVEDVAPGSYEFKVRLDGAWEYSWGAYEEKNDRIFNSQINCQITTETTSDIVVALDANGEDGNMWPVTFYAVGGEASKYSIVGDMTGWAGDAEAAAASDIPMYEIKAGKYVGIIKGVTGTQGFKVRNYSANPDNVWQDSWGVYDAENDRTHNGFEDNCTVELGDSVADIIVEFDTTKVDPAATANPDSAVNEVGFDFEKDGVNYWPVSYIAVDSKTVSPGGDQSSTDESSTVESSTEESSNNLGDNYETQITDYIFFDNSETKWETVHAHWWNSEFTKIVDLEGNLWPAEPLDADGNQDFGNAWPGTEMTQIEGTDIWQARVPFGATKIIFNNGKRDDEVNKDAIPDEQVQALADGDTSVAALLAADVGIQTTDLEFDSIANAGQVYKIDTTTAPTSARGNWKNRKWSYGAGAWEAYEGEYISELLNEAPVVSGNPDTGDDGNGDDGNNGNNGNNGDNGDGGSGNAPQTGDTAVPAAFAIVAIAALGVVLAVSKKKENA